MYTKDIINNYTELIQIKNDDRNLFILKEKILESWIKRLNINNNLII